MKPKPKEAGGHPIEFNLKSYHNNHNEDHHHHQHQGLGDGYASQCTECFFLARYCRRIQFPLTSTTVGSTFSWLGASPTMVQSAESPTSLLSSNGKLASPVSSEQRLCSLTTLHVKIQWDNNGHNKTRFSGCNEPCQCAFNFLSISSPVVFMHPAVSMLGWKSAEMLSHKSRQYSLIILKWHNELGKHDKIQKSMFLSVYA